MVWEKVVINGNEFPIDRNLRHALDTVKKIMKNKWDWTTITDGMEGSAKSTITAQMAYYLSDGKVTLDDVCFNTNQFVKRCLEQEEFRPIIYDEAFSGINSAAAMNKETRKIVSMMTEIRSRSIPIFIVAPSIFRLHSYFSMDRSRWLVHVYPEQRTMRRGQFGFYSYKLKKYLLIKGKKFHDHSVVKPNFRARFNKFFPFDWDEYEKKKRASQSMYLTEELKINPADAQESNIVRGITPFKEQRERKLFIQRNTFAYALSKFYSLDIIGSMIDVPKQSIHDMINTDRITIDENILKKLRKQGTGPFVKPYEDLLIDNTPSITNESSTDFNQFSTNKHNKKIILPRSVNENSNNNSDDVVYESVQEDSGNTKENKTSK